VTDLAVTSDGERIANPRHLARKARNLARYQRRLARCAWCSPTSQSTGSATCGPASTPR
jgi:hypothetical protein